MILENVTLNSIGLILDIIGASLLWYFGLPPNVAPKGKRYLIIGNDKNEKEKAEKYIFLAKIGFGFLIFGFLFQLADNLI